MTRRGRDAHLARGRYRDEPGDPRGDARSSAHAIAEAGGFELPRSLELSLMMHSVRRGRLPPDAVFDRIYPPAVERVSVRHWTPVKIARRAAELLAADAPLRVLDVGSGAGKFCLVGALTTPGQFTGIERRGHLVQLARAIAREYGAVRARYVQGDMREIDWSRFDALYLFNPFAENCFGPGEHVDGTVPLSAERFADDVAFASEQLARAPVGTRVVTYHGFGAELPRGFERKARERTGSDALELWTRVRA